MVDSITPHHHIIHIIAVTHHQQQQPRPPRLVRYTSQRDDLPQTDQGVGQGGVGEGVLLQVLEEQPLQGGREALQTVFEFGGHVGFAAVL